MRSSQVFVVEASAGSGKTTCLAKRYIRLCLALAATESLPIQSILAITFTNKATHAMKSRIYDFFKRMALKQLEPHEAADILKPFKMDEQKASALALDLMEALIRQYHYFQVQTIDSFMNILLSGCSFKIGLSSRFKIQRNAKEYLRLALDDLLEMAQKDKTFAGLFQDFVRQYLFLENRSGWFPKEDLLKVIEEMFKKYNTYQKSYVPARLDGDAFSYHRQIRRELETLKKLCPAKTHKKFQEHLDALLQKSGEALDLDDFKTFFPQEDFPVNKGGEVSVQLNRCWQRLRESLQGLCRYEAYGMYDPYIALFDKVMASFGALARRDDLLFLEELNRKAAALFEDGLVTVEELYFRLAARFRHYLIDEFQDTSFSQWRNLSSMVEEALAQGGSLFYVGDKKQAIYAFRGGESGLFDALQARLKDFGVQMTVLDKNYRSCPVIIEFNNRVFGPCLAHAHQMPGKDLTGGVVRVEYLQGRLKQDRAQEARQKLIPLIQDIRRRFALRDIAILTRGNDEIEEITQWLLQEGIYVSSDRSSDIKNNPLIGQMMSLLRFLLASTDNEAFVQFCLGDLLPQASGLAAQDLRDFLFDCARQSFKAKLSFAQCFEKTYPHIWKDLFAPLVEQAGVYPLYELATAMIRSFRCEQFFPQDQGFLMHWLELIKAREKEGCDLASFIAYFDQLEGQERFIPMAQVDAVKIWTVHKAKGLEFPVVIVPFLEIDVKAGSGGRDGSQAYMLDVQEQGLRLLRNKDVYRKFCPELQAKYDEEYQKAYEVELNIAYVALTRAIEELYIFVPSKVGNAANPALDLIPEDCRTMGTPKARPTAHEIMEVQHKIQPFISEAWKGLQEEFLAEPPKSASQAQRGEFYHAVLMQVGRVHESELEPVLKQSCLKAARFFPLSGEPEGGGRAVQSLSALIQSPEARPFFDLPADAEVFCEKEFVNAHGDTRRLDRLIVLKEEVWIVDFKFSSQAEEAHQKQVQEYTALVRPFYPKHKVSGYVLYFKL